MNQSDLFREITRTYQKFGWKLCGVLLDGQTQHESAGVRGLIPADVLIEEGSVNALWFARASEERETWELRLLSASPFALLETFESSMPDLERIKRRAIMVEKLQMNLPKFKV